MNKDQIKGNVKDAAGKVQQKAGEMMNDREQQNKGASRQVEGKVQEKWGDVKDAVKH